MVINARPLVLNIFTSRSCFAFACHLPPRLKIKNNPPARIQIWNVQTYGIHIAVAIETTDLITITVTPAEMNLALTEDNDGRLIVGIDINRKGRSRMNHTRPHLPL